MRLLDIGSGQGDFAAAARRRFPEAEILGLELSESGVELSRGKIPDATFLQCDLLAEGDPPPAYKGWATHAVCSEVLEHVEDPAHLLIGSQKYMAPGCVLVVTVPGGPMSEFDKHIGHRTHFTPESLREVLENAGFAVETAAGAGFPFFNLYRLAVVLRGKRLIRDIDSSRSGGVSGPAALVMSIFRAAFHCNLDSGRLGWQVIARARLPDVGGHPAVQ